LIPRRRDLFWHSCDRVPPTSSPPDRFSDGPLTQLRSFQTELPRFRFCLFMHFVHHRFTLSWTCLPSCNRLSGWLSPYPSDRPLIALHSPSTYLPQFDSELGSDFPHIAQSLNSFFPGSTRLPGYSLSPRGFINGILQHFGYLPFYRVWPKLSRLLILLCNSVRR